TVLFGNARFIWIDMSRKPKDLTGLQVNWLTVLGDSGERDNNGSIKWLCECKCGNKHVVRGSHLKSRKAISCGCFSTLYRKELNSTHGGSHTSEYGIWRGVIDRCNNPKSHNYIRYGGRGIKVCDRWLEFKNFIADMGARPGKEYSID